MSFKITVECVNRTKKLTGNDRYKDKEIELLSTRTANFGIKEYLLCRFVPFISQITIFRIYALRRNEICVYFVYSLYVPRPYASQQIFLGDSDSLDAYI